MAIRQNPQTHTDERFYFAEKALPKWFYLGSQEMLVVIPNLGHETDKNLVYHYVAGRGQPNESTATDKLPVSARALRLVQPQ
ncbi:hypothetical protein [Burkholderia ubonensis]|uniref:hypothetical protein n=1 Tax=Burkholderia ubonensis TaxID=101571 RepID=UPI0018DF5C08|nr:hypothetical protein [Burkholderia ubonensis]